MSDLPRWSSSLDDGDVIPFPGATEWVAPESHPGRPTPSTEPPALPTLGQLRLLRREPAPPYPPAPAWPADLAERPGTLWIPAIVAGIEAFHAADPAIARPADEVEIGLHLPAIDALRLGPEFPEPDTQVALGEIARLGLPRLQRAMPDLLLADTWEVARGTPHDARLAAVERWMAQEASSAPLPWVALSVAAGLPLGGPRMLAFLQGEAPYERLALSFEAVADFHDVTTWPLMLQHCTDYWRDPRSQLFFRALFESLSPELRPRERGRRQGVEVVPALDPRVEQLERQLAEARRELVELRAQAVTRQRALGSAWERLARARGRGDDSPEK